MHRNVTAIYRTYATADLVRRKLAELGISWDDMHVIPERDEPVGTDGGREGSRYSDQLHDLHLPDDDVETYQHSVRRGDYVVSAEVDEDQVERVQSIMSRPEEEAHNLDKRSEEFRGAGIDPYSDPNSRRTNPDVLARRVPGRTDPYTRSYSRDARLERRLDWRLYRQRIYERNYTPDYRDPKVTKADDKQGSNAKKWLAYAAAAIAALLLFWLLGEDDAVDPAVTQEPTAEVDEPAGGVEEPVQ